MRLNSLAFRLFASAAALVLVVLPLTAFILISVYRGAVERNFDARLDLYLTNLVAGSAEIQGEKPAPPNLGGPLFERPFSGWYWQITPSGADTPPLYSSSSLLDATLPLPSRNGVRANANNVRKANVEGPEGQRLRVLERDITLGQESAQSYSYAVAGDSAEMELDIGQFTRLLIAALSLLGAGLVLATLVQVRFGLRPLRAIQAGLAAIRSGEEEELAGEYPSEIQPLQEELNALIQSNKEIVERARTHVGNLAHALKTPLSVITNEARDSDSAVGRKVVEQAELMRTQIGHHLDRARMAARAGAIGSVTDAHGVADALVRALSRIYEERKLAIAYDGPRDARFQGERQDLEEMMGNLLDNACKWAKSKVHLSIAVTDPEEDGLHKRLVILVDDDGPGLSEQERERAVQRGQRLDESKPGSGLGLSIVAELAHLYKGSFSLEPSPRGGLRGRLDLPAA